MYSLQFGYILYSLPPLVTSLMFVIFKLRKLLGVIQKFILSIMFIDLSYTSPSNIRDITLRVSQMHYGFKEYRVCVEIIVSFRVQMFFYVTSVWLKSIMSLHQVLFVGFPMRVKQHNLSAYSWPRNPVYYISSVSHFSRLHPKTSDSGIQTRLPS